MLIDCTTCVARDIACADCVITVLLQSPPAHPAVPARDDPLALDDSEQVALGALARAGLVPPLRLVRPLDAQVGQGSEVGQERPEGLSDTA